MKIDQTQLRVWFHFLAQFGKVATVIALSAVAAIGQEGIPKRGFQPAGSYAISDIDSISLTSGNLSLQLPLATLPPGRGGLSAKLNLLYNSKLLDSNPHWATYFQGSNQLVLQQNLLAPSSEGGWRYGIGYSLQTTNRMDQYVAVTDLPPGTNPTPQCPSSIEAVKIHKLRIAFPDGSSHEMRPVGFDDYQDDGFYEVRFDGLVENCSTGQFLTNQKLTYYSIDGSYLRLEIDLDSVTLDFDDPWTLFFPDGSRYTAGNWPDGRPPRIYDRNDNFVEIVSGHYNGHEAVRLKDAFNREIILEYNAVYSEDAIRYSGYGGQQLTTRVQWTYFYVFKNYHTTNDMNHTQPPFVEMYFQMVPAVSKVILPQPGTGLDYTFAYSSYGMPGNGWGEVNSITLPTGNVPQRAKTTYAYRFDDPSYVGSPIKWSDVLHEQSPVSKTLTYQKVYDGQTTTTTETSQYGISPAVGLSAVTAPDGGTTFEYFSPVTDAFWQKGLVYKSIQPDGTILERVWKQNVPDGFVEVGSPTMNKTGHNVYVKTEYMTKSLTPSSPQPTDKTAVRDYFYDKNGNVLEVHEYDWVNYSSVHSGGVPSGLPSGAVLKKVTQNSYHSDTPEASLSYAGPLAYNKLTAARVVRLIKSMEIRSGTSLSAALARTEYDYDNVATTGNLTNQRSWDSTKGALNRPLNPGTYLTIQHNYGTYGNRLRTYDANNVRTEFTYDANQLYVIKNEAAFGEPVMRTIEHQYDQATGLVTMTKDTDNNLITRTTYDAYGRPTLVEEADGQPMERRTATEYSDEFRRVIVRSDLRTTGDQKLVTVQHYDQLGRLCLSRSMEPGNDPYTITSGIKSQFRYAYHSGNRYELVSNPYRTDLSSGPVESNMGWTMTKYDQGGRPISVQTFSGGNAPAPFGTGAASTGIVTTVSTWIRRQSRIRQARRGKALSMDSDG